MMEITGDLNVAGDLMLGGDVTGTMNGGLISRK